MEEILLSKNDIHEYIDANIITRYNNGNNKIKSIKIGENATLRYKFHKSILSVTGKITNINYNILNSTDISIENIEKSREDIIINSISVKKNNKLNEEENITVYTKNLATDFEDTDVKDIYTSAYIYLIVKDKKITETSTIRNLSLKEDLKDTISGDNFEIIGFIYNRNNPNKINIDGLYIRDNEYNKSKILFKDIESFELDENKFLFYSYN